MKTAKRYFLLPCEDFVMIQHVSTLMKEEGFTPLPATQILFRGMKVLMPTIELDEKMYGLLVNEPPSIPES